MTIDLTILNSDLTRFERESIARLREEEARYKGLTTLRRYVKELSAALPSVRRAPTSRNKEDPTLMSGGASSPVNPASNASSPYYNLLRRRSPRLGSTSRGRNAARTYTPKYISLANYTRRLYVVGPKERKRRRRDFKAATKAKRLIDAKELVKEERRAAERSRYLSYSDPPIFNLRSPSRSRSPSPNFLASYAISAIEIL
ncbi:hypothetical protein D6D21_10755 [Aureobasidium pullulans]|uniref:Uncharacterized protein n=1 Tax=Aureobasidium pullulans TaxID=5580 RepID=A0AB74IGJ5_AURPU|nr:hypothetical protein D6D21_10755 [Aureobasidium pullulans]